MTGTESPRRLFHAPEAYEGQGSEFSGSNSQWKTDFRRDHRTATAYHYNVDGTAESSRPPHQDHHDLLRHRCLVRPPAAATPTPQLTPAERRLTEPRPAA
ncbi:hypothetical protein ACFC58_40520 [Kitasatospora purpeofusca]|uniref:hypothetical protein n=1 Tax=Kitasatospora purpeofusca TaxID=67352 RepID=UPI0035E3B7C2